MTGTFISQRQFDDIDACMSYMETVANEVSGFTKAAEVGPYGPTRPPTIAMRAGSAQARLWRLKTDPGFYRFISGYVDELALFTDYLSSYISALSPAKRKRPVSDLGNVTAPLDLSPKYATSPMTDCFKLLQYHHEWVRAFSEMVKIANCGYATIRKTIYNVLPRVFDFMSFHLQTASARNLGPVALNAARRHEKNVRGHYLAGMGAVANFLAQFQRINTLLEQANQRFDGLENLATLARFDTNMKLVMVELKQAQRFSMEIETLRTS